jgi:hypothetical protein
MFNKNVLFIVGAGASAECGMPVGRTLRDAIAKDADIRFADGGRGSASGSASWWRVPASE